MKMVGQFLSFSPQTNRGQKALRGHPSLLPLHLLAAETCILSLPSILHLVPRFSFPADVRTRQLSWRYVLLGLTIASLLELISHSSPAHPVLVRITPYVHLMATKDGLGIFRIVDQDDSLRRLFRLLRPNLSWMTSNGANHLRRRVTVQLAMPCL